MPINNPREPPILEIKENSFILGICVIFKAICTSGGKLRSQSRVVNYEKHYKCFA